MSSALYNNCAYFAGLIFTVSRLSVKDCKIGPLKSSHCAVLYWPTCVINVHVRVCTCIRHGQHVYVITYMHMIIATCIYTSVDDRVLRESVWSSYACSLHSSGGRVPGPPPGTHGRHLRLHKTFLHENRWSWRGERLLLLIKAGSLLPLNLLEGRNTGVSPSLAIVGIRIQWNKFSPMQ